MKHGQRHRSICPGGGLRSAPRLRCVPGRFPTRFPLIIQPVRQSAREGAQCSDGSGPGDIATRNNITIKKRLRITVETIDGNAQGSTGEDVAARIYQKRRRFGITESVSGASREGDAMPGDVGIRAMRMGNVGDVFSRVFCGFPVRVRCGRGEAGGGQGDARRAGEPAGRVRSPRT